MLSIIIIAMYVDIIMPMMDSLIIDSRTPLEVVNEAIPVLTLVLELM